MSDGKYDYKGKNLTSVILMKTERVAELMSIKENRDFDDCLRDFAASETYKNLQTPDTLLWGENSEFILDDYYRESKGMTV
ncbi:hypothetical protein AGMMS49983_04930 [Clostridia bacterium]|nr:hypothetical protein AGMMS49983_04930 [Clostridia bacterium]